MPETVDLSREILETIAIETGRMLAPDPEVRWEDATRQTEIAVIIRREEEGARALHHPADTTIVANPGNPPPSQSHKINEAQEKINLQISFYCNFWSSKRREKTRDVWKKFKLNKLSLVKARIVCSKKLRRFLLLLFELV
jgi:hypothetical protein